MCEPEPDFIYEYRLIHDLITLLDAPGKGGNISVKFEDRIAIKASGQNMKKEHLISICDLEGNSKYSYDLRTGYSFMKSKPSMEIQMHLNLKSKYVLHYHPAYVLPYLCSNYDFNDFSFGTTVSYANPGKDLAEAVKNTINEPVLWLNNHGVIIHSDSIDEIRTLYRKIRNTFFRDETIPLTPDDVVDSTDEELLLFRHYAELISNRQGLELKYISAANRDILLADENEKFRMEQK